jgi:uncharacterized protein YgiM (DUF1202 family)
MQNQITKIIVILLLFWAATPQPIQAQPDTRALFYADSLFSERDWQASYAVYENLFHEQGWYTSQMLLRMAYVREQAEDYTKALYYINLYHLYHPEKDVSEKLKELSAKKNYSGYAYSDFDNLLILYQQYREYLLVFLMVATTIFFIAIIIKKVKKELVLYHQLIFLFFLALTFVVINFADSYKKGIIANDTAYLMTGPSAGASLYQVVNQGHRVTIKGKKDVWYAVEWQGEEAYIHQQNLLVIER